jgi:aspartyl aminopeptidase
MSPRTAKLSIFATAAVAQIAWIPIATAAPRPAPTPPFADRYKSILARALTPSRFVQAALELARGAGFRAVDASDPHTLGNLSPGARVAFTYRGNTLALVVLGTDVARDGFRVVAAHIDAPHLRLEAAAIGRSGDAAVFRARAYGGIKRFHWLGRPLQLVGEAHIRGGRIVPIDLGPRDGMVFFATPLHGAQSLAAAAPHGLHGGDALVELIAASIPAQGRTANDPLRTRVLTLFYNKFQVDEEGLRTARLSFVPAEPPRDIGLDRALVGAHGQDDRACSAVTLLAILDAPERPKHTQVAYFVDREEIGSTGTTGAAGRFLTWVTRAVLRGVGRPHGADAIRALLARSEALSADVQSAMNPLFSTVFDRRNAGRLGAGPVITKSSGGFGKIGGYEASAEMMSRTLRRLSGAKVPFQVSTFGRVDEGGGATIAAELAARGIDVLDIGAPVLSMHSPLEIAAYSDLTALAAAFHAFWLAD